MAARNRRDHRYETWKNNGREHERRPDERGLKRNTSLRYVTSVDVRFTVKNTGVASGISFAPSSDLEMERCMSLAIGRWKFPTFTGDPVQLVAPVHLVAK